MVTRISKIIGRKLSIQQESLRERPKKSEVDRLQANTKKAKKLLNWSPKLATKSAFNNSLKKTINWFSQKENLNQYKIDVLND